MSFLRQGVRGNGFQEILLALTIMGAICGLPFSVAAQDDDDGEGETERNWELRVGGVVWWESIYEGADELKFMPLPMIYASYDWRYFKLFLEGDEAGAAVKFGASFPLSLAAGIGLGEDRDNDDLDILDGSPTIKNSFLLFGALNLELPWDVMLSAQAKYFPITATYDETDRADQDYSGMLFDLTMEREWLLFPFLVQIGGGCSWMNNEYAEAYFSVTYPTSRLGAFEADGGLHDAHLSTMVMLFFNERIGMGTMAEGQYLLGDAADSPFTQAPLQPSFGVMAWYRF